MINTYDFQVERPEMFSQLAANDLLFLHYKCPQETKYVYVYNHFNQIERIRDIMIANTMHSKGIALYSKISSPSVSCDDLKKIKTPVLLIQGDRSPLFLTSIINELDRCLSNNEKATLMNASHGLEFDNPAEFNKIVPGFIDKN